jgi:hypothetical protein
MYVMYIFNYIIYEVLHGALYLEADSKKKANIQIISYYYVIHSRHIAGRMIASNCNRFSFLGRASSSLEPATFVILL